MPLAWAPDAQSAAHAVRERTRRALTGWKVMSCGPDVARHPEVAQQFVDAGSDHIVTLHAGPDPDGLGSSRREPAQPLPAPTPSGDAQPPGLAEKVLGAVRG